MVEIGHLLIVAVQYALPVAASLLLIVLFPPLKFLKRDEQLLLEKLSDKEVRNGPGVCVVIPFIMKAKVRQATLLEELDYIIVTDSLSGVQRTEMGPKLVFIGAYETVMFKSLKHVLEKDEYIKVRDSKNGEVRVVQGPGVFVPTPTESTPDGKQKGVSLEKHEYVRITDTTTGVVRIEKGEKLVFPGPMDVMESKRAAWSLEKHEYVRITDTSTGVVRIEKGEKLLFPGPMDVVENKKAAWSLEKHEYIRITDTTTGVVRIEKGEQLVFPGPMDVVEIKRAAWKLRRNEYIKLIDTATGQIRVEKGEKIVFPTATEDLGKQKNFAVVSTAVEINDETAVLVESKETGQQRLVKESGIFFPQPHDEILEIRKLIRVQPHEVAIVQDNTGKYLFYEGSAGGEGTAFFLPPHHELVTMHWASAASPDEVAANKMASGKKQANFKVPVTKIDTRSQYAFFEYNVRTSDNVELVLEGTIFWQVVDVPKMIQTTGDPKGDVWFHARSSMIQAVSRVTLEVFMTEFNDIVKRAASVQDDFYVERGVKMHSMEVTRYACADAQTSHVLQEIIQETTNRINRMQKQQSENDVQREKMSGDIEVEKQKTALVQAQCDNDRMRAIIEGEADGLRMAKSAATFFSVLTETPPKDEEQLQLFRFFQDQLESTKRTAHISTGNANLFLAPQDMNLKLNMMNKQADAFHNNGTHADPCT
jgi:regulator of protease activity HflC (stomatin/prohibitin superfamily)